QLGMIAQDRGRLEDAERWYQQSLTIKENLGDRPGMARSYAQFGLLAEKRGNERQAMNWALRCIVLFPDFPHPYSGSAPSQLARLTHKLGESVLEHLWTQLTDHTLPQHIRTYVHNHPPANGGDNR
ncbi:tetratricopeptide repeat protein, partial [Actinokineospora diospyrosa]